jgi:dihydroorotate dehydrogenase
VLGKYEFTQKLTTLTFDYKNPVLDQKISGIKFENPVGLAAGFDKNAWLIDILPFVGFGFMEVGSITGEKCRGNEKPRLWRLINSKALMVNYGLTNNGAEKISRRLKDKKFHFPVGINIAKTNNKATVQLKKGIADYVKTAETFKNIGDYMTINLSCPNSFGGQDFQKKSRLEKLLTEIKKLKLKKPIFLKIAPDLSEKQLDEIINLTKKYKLTGFICSNLTKNRNNPKITDENLPEQGSISGKPAEELANQQIEYIYKQTKGKFIIIGCGGIFSAKDAYKKIKLGASLVQLITGMIFEGPQLISEINQGLVKLLEQDGYKNISEAIGSGL